MEKVVKVINLKIRGFKLNFVFLDKLLFIKDIHFIHSAHLQIKKNCKKTEQSFTVVICPILVNCKFTISY